MKEILIELGKQLIILLAMIIITYITTKIKKPNVLDKIRPKIPKYIIDAEKRGFSTGEAKLKHVLSLCYANIKNMTHQKIEKVISEYHDILEAEIETILETPQKKG